MADQKLEGRVILFDPEKGFGFIAIAGRENNLFVHQNDLAKSNIFLPLVRGQIVRCREGVSPRSNKACAVDIELAA